VPFLGVLCHVRKLDQYRKEELMALETSINLSIDMQRFQLQMFKVGEALDGLAKQFEDRDKWHATVPGQWPDRYVLLNRFVRTGARPLFIFND
jgi:hypothetical protein